MRYRTFADEVRAKGITIDDDSMITFVLPMPKSWSKKKKIQMEGQPHRQKPDIDNLAKSILDACFDDDSMISMMFCRKIWGERGAIDVSSRS